jgi:hypothetical protein
MNPVTSVNPTMQYSGGSACYILYLYNWSEAHCSMQLKFLMKTARFTPYMRCGFGPQVVTLVRKLLCKLASCDSSLQVVTLVCKL